ncbi:MAG: FAD:protein FMN transferase [Candidatus Theseobacter exili]|nr:FAD:protein FMN transferase [Candidatus Theseobacter exili]
MKISSRLYLAFFILAGIYFLSLLPVKRIFSHSNSVIGTFATIYIVSADRIVAEKACNAAFQAVRNTGKLMNRYDPDSVLSRLNSEGSSEALYVGTQVFGVIKYAGIISDLTKGALDITVLPLLQLWKKAETEDVLPSDKEVKEAVLLVNYKNLELYPSENKVKFFKEGMGIDLGSIAKGAAIDEAARTIRTFGFSDFLIDIGGDIYVSGRKPGGKKWIVGVQHPRMKKKVLDKIKLTDCAVATSGDYERYFQKNGKKYHHILDPRTGYPADRCISTTVVASDAITADAIATAIFVMKPSEGLDFLDRNEEVEGFIVVGKEGSLHAMESKGYKYFRK